MSIIGRINNTQSFSSYQEGQLDSVQRNATDKSDNLAGNKPVKEVDKINIAHDQIDGIVARENELSSGAKLEEVADAWSVLQSVLQGIHKEQQDCSTVHSNFNNLNPSRVFSLISEE
ncbi:MAG: hypothetical protein V1872_08970 [bacterium]